MLEQQSLRSGSLISFQSLVTRRCLRVESSDRISAQGCHPFLLQDRSEKERVSFELVSCSGGETLSLGGQVFVAGADGKLLSCNPRGEVYLESPSEDKTVMKFKRWTLVARGADANGIIRPDIEIFLKSAFGGLLRVSGTERPTEERVNASGSVSDDSAAWSLQPAGRLPLPAWLANRASAGASAFGELAAAQSAWRGSRARARLKFESLREAEAFVLEEVALAFLGAQGQFIVRTGDGGWILEHGEQFDPGFAALIGRALPVPAAVDRLRRFESAFGGPGAGLQFQALAAAVAAIRRDALALAHRVESSLRARELDAQRLLFMLTPAMKVLDPLTRLLAAVEKGDRPPLSVIAAAVQAAPDAESAEAARALFAATGRPLLAMLQRWLRFGRLDDCRNEFFIEERPDEDPRGLTRFRLVPSRLPGHLTGLGPRILAAGAAANVLAAHDPRAAPLSTGSDLLGPAAAEFGSPIPAAAVEAAAMAADRALVKLLVGDMRLAARLESLRRFLLLGAGDFLLHFFDLSEAELRKQSRAVSAEKLSNFLELAVRASSVSADPFREDLSVSLASSPLPDAFDAATGSSNVSDRPASNRRGSDLLQFSLRAPWPLSLLLPPALLAKLGLFSRHLVTMKFCERQLFSAWLAFQEHREVRGKALVVGRWILSKALALSRALIGHATLDVAQPRWVELSRRASSSGEFQQLTDACVEFVESLLRDSLLTDKKFRDGVWTLNMFFHYLAENFKEFLQANFSNDPRVAIVISPDRR